MLSFGPRGLCTTAMVALVGAHAQAQPRDTARLERMFQVEIAALLCEVELPDDVEDGLDRGIRAEQRRLRLTERQMAQIYEQVRSMVVAQQRAACESLRQLDPSPDDLDEQ
jgi:hypothetical protein